MPLILAACLAGVEGTNHKHADLAAVAAPSSEKYNTQVIPWTQRKRFAENLVGGSLEVIGQGGSDSCQQGEHAKFTHSYP